MLHAIIIDDEYDALKSLGLLIKRFVPEIKVVASSVDSHEGIELINNYRPDIVFLDICMPGCSGFELLENLDYRLFHLVFSTAHQEFALQAIKQNAVDYLLKPVCAEELRCTVQKIIEREKERDHRPDLLRLLKEIPLPQQVKIPLPTKQSITYVLAGDILYIEAKSNQSVIALSNGMVVTVNQSLKEYEQSLCGPAPGFIRLHNSFIINVSYATRYLKEHGGYAVIRDQKTIPISKHKKAEFLKMINFGTSE